jgi:aldose 1-epimerase
LIHLRAGSSEAMLLPHLGGAIGSFSVAGRAVLRPTASAAAHPLDSASFPLVPYCNRIARGRFTFDGEDHALPRNVPEFAHPLHGLGWLKTWTVDRQTVDSALLSCTHEADADWPWDWSATQHFMLEDGALRVTLDAVNRSSRPMPCGLGHHPYLVRRPGAVLAFTAKGVWRNDADDLPVEAMPADSFGDFAKGAEPQGAGMIDNCWHGWDGTATWDKTIIVSSPEARYLHVFAPPGKDFICLEPTSQMPDAVNRPPFAAAGGRVLSAGATQRLAMEIRVR